MKISVIIHPDHLNDAGDVFELRQGMSDAPLFLTTILQPVYVTFEDGERMFHIPLTLALLREGDTKRAATELYEALESLRRAALWDTGKLRTALANAARILAKARDEFPATASAPTSPDRKPTEGEPTVTNQERPRHRFIDSGNGKCISCGEVEGDNHAR